MKPPLLPVDVGWRLGLIIGPVIGVMIWRLRRHIPESPRWLVTHGQPEVPERVVAGIEREVEAGGATLPPVDESKVIEMQAREPVRYTELARLLFRSYPSRSFLGFMLMVTQSFLYNAIFFTYALILKEFYGVGGGAVGYFIFPFAVGNLAGPFLLGRLFDTVGRRVMIGSTYCTSAVLLFVTGLLFKNGVLNAVTQTVLWCVIFFIASAAASSAYLTVSEIFPLEMRAQAIALFFAVSQFFGGVIAPWLFGALIQGGRSDVFIGYTVGAALMFLGGLTAFAYGVNAERKGLESIAQPLSARALAMGNAAASRLTGGLQAGVRRAPVQKVT